MLFVREERMAKLMEKNGAEMCAALVSIAEPIRHFIEDKEFLDTFKRCTAKGMDSQLHGILTIYADLVPLLFGDAHRRDTLAILATVEGTTVSGMLKMNGADLLADALKAWKEQIEPFFTKLGLSV